MFQIVIFVRHNFSFKMKAILRKCIVCKEYQSVNNYYSYKNSKDGLSTRCKSCIKKENKEATFRRKVKIVETNCDLENEIWSVVAGFEGLYEISNLGRVKNIKPYLSIPDRKGKVRNKILKLKSGSKYTVVALYRIGEKRKWLRVNKMVANVFVPNPHNYPIVNHLDGNKRNDRWDNLEWCTYSQNSIHSVYVLGNDPAKNKRKAVIQLNNSGEIVNRYRSASDVSGSVGSIFSRWGVGNCLRGKSKMHSGFIFRYEFEN